MNTLQTTARFAPELYLKNVSEAIEFYHKAFDAKELRRWSNPDGSVHVAELMIQEAIFHLHEEVLLKQEASPETLGGTSVLLGLFVPDPDAVIARAVSAGAIEVSPMQDYDYGYRQGTVKDPFGHLWMIEKEL